MNNEINQNNNQISNEPTHTPVPIMPTVEPVITQAPTVEPTLTPVPIMPTVEPVITQAPTVEPTLTPAPTIPTVEPVITQAPTLEPTLTPVPIIPTVEPVITQAPTVEPTLTPVPIMPTVEPVITQAPTLEPTLTPVPTISTVEPVITQAPTVEPTLTPVPTISTVEPVITQAPTVEPTLTPVPIIPTVEPVTNNTEISKEENPYEMKQMKATQKKKIKLPIKIGIIIILISIIVLVTIYLLNGPQKTFESSINKVTKAIVNHTKDNEIDKTLNDIKINLKTDDEKLKKYENYTLGIKGGIDNKHKKLEGKIYLTDESNTEYSYTGYIINSKLYSMFSNFDKLIYNQNIEKNELKQVFESFNNSKTDDVKYLTTFILNSLKNNLNKQNFSQKLTTIIINNKKVLVTKNSYKLDKKEKKRLTKKIIQDIIKDEQALAAIKKIANMDEKQLKSIIENYNEDYEGTEYINIYNSLLGKATGIDIEKDNKTQISYYKNNKNFEIKINEYDDILQINGIKKEALEITINQNEKTIATAKISEYSENEKSMEYDLKESNIKGSLYYKKDNNKESYRLKINNEKNKYELNIINNKDTNAEIADIDETKAIEVTDEELDKIIKDFIKSLENTSISLISA